MGVDEDPDNRSNSNPESRINIVRGSTDGVFYVDHAIRTDGPPKAGGGYLGREREEIARNLLRLLPPETDTRKAPVCIGSYSKMIRNRTELSNSVIDGIIQLLREKRPDLEFKKGEYEFRG